MKTSSWIVGLTGLVVAMTGCVDPVSAVSIGTWHLALSPRSSELPDRDVDLADTSATCDPGCSCQVSAFDGNDDDGGSDAGAEGSYDETCPGTNRELSATTGIPTPTTPRARARSSRPGTKGRAWCSRRST